MISTVEELITIPLKDALPVDLEGTAACADFPREVLSNVDEESIVDYGSAFDGKTSKNLTGALFPALSDNDTSDIVWSEGGQSWEEMNDVPSKVGKHKVDSIIFTSLVCNQLITRKGEHAVYAQCGIGAQIVRQWAIGIELDESEKYAVTGTSIGALRICDYERGIFLHGLIDMSERVEQLKQHYPLFYDERKPLYVQRWKIDVPRSDAEKVFEKIEKNRATLAQSLIYIDEVDYTQDFGATLLPKEIMIGALAKKGVKLIGAKGAAAYLQKFYTNVDTRSDELYLLDNSSSVGESCFSFLCCRDGISYKLKIYNKAVQMWESRSVSKKLGSNLASWFDYTKESSLREIIEDEKTQQHGLTRVEITCYDGEVARDTVAKTLNWFVPFLTEITASTPISVQWHNLCSNTSRQYPIVFDVHTGDYTICRWTNKRTKKSNTISSREGGARTYEAFALALSHMTKSGNTLSLASPTLTIYLLDYEIYDAKSEVLLKKHGGASFEALMKKASPRKTKRDEEEYMKQTCRNFRMYIHKVKRQGTFSKEVLSDNARAVQVLPWAEGKSQAEVDERLNLVGYRKHRNLQWHVNTTRMSVKRYRREGALSILLTDEDCPRLHSLQTIARTAPLIRKKDAHIVERLEDEMQSRKAEHDKNLVKDVLRDTKYKGEEHVEWLREEEVDRLREGKRQKKQAKLKGQTSRSGKNALTLEEGTIYQIGTLSSMHFTLTNDRYTSYRKPKDCPSFAIGDSFVRLGYKYDQHNNKAALLEILSAETLERKELTTTMEKEKTQKKKNIEKRKKEEALANIYGEGWVESSLCGKSTPNCETFLAKRMMRSLNITAFVVCLYRKKPRIGLMDHDGRIFALLSKENIDKVEEFFTREGFPFSSGKWNSSCCTIEFGPVFEYSKANRHREVSISITSIEKNEKVSSIPASADCLSFMKKAKEEGLDVSKKVEWKDDDDRASHSFYGEHAGEAWSTIFRDKEYMMDEVCEGRVSLANVLFYQHYLLSDEYANDRADAAKERAEAAKEREKQRIEAETKRIAEAARLEEERKNAPMKRQRVDSTIRRNGEIGRGDYEKIDVFLFQKFAETTCHFGKHSGKAWGDILKQHPSYVDWVYDNFLDMESFEYDAITFFYEQICPRRAKVPDQRQLAEGTVTSV